MYDFTGNKLYVVITEDEYDYTYVANHKHIGTLYTTEYVSWGNFDSSNQERYTEKYRFVDLTSLEVMCGDVMCATKLARIA